MTLRTKITLSLLLSFFFHLYGSGIENKLSRQDYWIERYLSVSYPLKKIVITSSYGVRRDPFKGIIRNHTGLDLQAHYEEVLSMLNGQVRAVGEDNASGIYIIISYGKYTVSYCHLSKVLVKKEDLVFAGDIIGISGNTGRSTGPHLHLTCKYNNERINPLEILNIIDRIRKESIEALSLLKLPPPNKQSFIKLYADAAMRQQIKYGIPASVTLAQMALESGWGTSRLAREHNNYFGIKASRQWLANNGLFVYQNDDMMNEKFCRFSSPLESMEYHSKILMSDRYQKCHLYEPTDYHNWLVGIKAGGYASAPNYVSKCEYIIVTNKLYVYDRIASLK